MWDAPTTATTNSAANPLAALERMDITPEQRNYWAFKLPVQAPVPGVANRDLTNPIDRFLEKARVDRGLTAAPRADRLTLVRRAYLDLLGLPPTPAQVAEFMADQTPQAWERLIDTLLASPHYGERYGRHWLDVARYADSGGFEYDVHRPNAWRYRDYVIKSFNDDKPYNLFLTEQIAGDEMDWKTDQTLIATGFLRMGPRVLFREKDNPERRFDYLDEIIGTIGKGTLGLTVNCARCHNHKFDPIAAKDYYSIQASLFGYVETEVPLAPRAEAEAYLAKNDEINAQACCAEVGDRGDREAASRPRWSSSRFGSKFADAHLPRGGEAGSERTPGEKLLAIQVYEAVNVPAAQIDKVLSPEDAREEEGSDGTDRGARQAAAGAAADGRDCHRRRPPLLAARRRRRHHQLPEVPHPAAVPGQLRPQGRQVPGAAVVLPGSRRPREPRLADEARLHRRHHLRQSADRDSAAGRQHLGPPARAGAVDCARRNTR